jgi:hypothetical protein
MGVTLARELRIDPLQARRIKKYEPVVREMYSAMSYLTHRLKKSTPERHLTEVPLLLTSIE